MTKHKIWIGLGFLLFWTAGCQALSPPTEPISWAWSYQAGDYIRNKPAVDTEIVYIGADDNHMHAVDANTGEPLWSYETADNVTSSAATGDGGIYFGSWDGAIYALDAVGELRWQYQTDDWVSATPVLRQGVLYVGSQDGVLYALNAESGELIWRYVTNGRIDASAVVAGDLLVFNSTDGYTHALDLKDGQRQWFFYADGTGLAPPVVAGEQVFISSLNQTLYALDLARGEPRWTFAADAPLSAAPAVTDDILYIGAEDGMVWALDLENGHPKWQWESGEMIRAEPALWNEVLFVGTSNGNLYALDSRSGIRLWDYRLGGVIAQGPTIDDNRLYVGSTAKQLQAFDLESEQLSKLLAVATPSPDDAQALSPQDAAAFYAERARSLPAIVEYDRLWSAKANLPDIDAVRTLQDVIAFRPQSPAAYQAYALLARYYADQEASAAEDSYRAALALDDNVALRLELAHYLEAHGNEAAAYAEYRSVLSRQPDAFEGMRRTAPDILQVAEDLNKALYYTDVLETLRNVAEAGAVPLRAEAYLGLGRYADAAAAYRTQIRSDPDDETARMGLALAQAWLGDGEAALDLYSTIDTPESQRRQAQLLVAEEPEFALDLYQGSPFPTAWWAATALLENQGRITETLPIYERLAEAESQYADDAAYRLYTLGQRLNNNEAEDKGLSLLNSFGLNWLTLRSADDPLQIETAPAIAVDTAVMDKVTALEAIGRDDLARLELIFAARFRNTPETDLAMAQALTERGDVRESQLIAERYINAQERAPLAFWELSYPRPYSELVQAAAEEFGVDPLLIWAVMREESRFDPEAQSHAGARGLMQVIPATQTWIAEELGEAQAPGDAYDPVISIRMGAWLLAFLTNYFGGDLELAVPAYNAGAGSVESWQSDPRVEGRDDLLRWIGYNETRLYIKRVLLSYQVYRTLYGSE